MKTSHRHASGTKRVAFTILLALNVCMLGVLIAPMYLWWDSISARLEVLMVLIGVLAYALWNQFHYSWLVAKRIANPPQR
jgi:hypothetical protein